MEKEFNLSNEIIEVSLSDEMEGKYIEVQDVKEFIRKLKMEIDSIDFEIIGLRGLVKNKIDKLAGDKLKEDLKK